VRQAIFVSARASVRRVVVVVSARAFWFAYVLIFVGGFVWWCESEGATCLLAYGDLSGYSWFDAATPIAPDASGNCAGFRGIRADGSMSWVPDTVGMTRGEYVSLIGGGGGSCPSGADSASVFPYCIDPVHGTFGSQYLPQLTVAEGTQIGMGIFVIWTIAFGFRSVGRLLDQMDTEGEG
jgi:hypothetical protein